MHRHITLAGEDHERRDRRLAQFRSSSLRDFVPAEKVKREELRDLVGWIRSARGHDLNERRRNGDLERFTSLQATSPRGPCTIGVR